MLFSGRILVSETIAVTQPLLNNLTNAELAASQGADMLFDVNRPQVAGLPEDVPAPGNVAGKDADDTQPGYSA